MGCFLLMSSEDFEPPAEVADAPPPVRNPKRAAFLKRSLSTIILVAGLVATVGSGQKWLMGVVLILVSLAAITEYQALTRLFSLHSKRKLRTFRIHGFLVTLGFTLMAFSPLFGWESLVVWGQPGLWIAIFIISWMAWRIRWRLDGENTFFELAMGVFGFVYCVVLFSFVGKILALDLRSTAGEPSAAWYIVYLLVVTKLTDIGAYLVGSVFGRDKMIPHVSPAKTWQGFAGALLFAMGGSLVLTSVLGDQIPLIPRGIGLALAFAVALMAVLGDLAESVIKRSLNVKDSSHLMPGIGGILDLIDSILFTAPLVYVYLKWSLTLP